MNPRSNKAFRFVVLLATALAGPFLFPPHIIGVYVPLGGVLIRKGFWTGQPFAYYLAFVVELTVYMFLLDVFFRILVKFRA